MRQGRKGSHLLGPRRAVLALAAAAAAIALMVFCGLHPAEKYKVRPNAIVSPWKDTNVWTDRQGVSEAHETAASAVRHSKKETKRGNHFP